MRDEKRCSTVQTCFTCAADVGRKRIGKRRDKKDDKVRCNIFDFNFVFYSVYAKAGTILFRQKWSN